MPFIFRVTLPKNSTCWAACGAPERSKGEKLCAMGAGVGVRGVSPPTRGGLGGLPQKNFSFENALGMGLRLSEVHI